MWYAIVISQKYLSEKCEVSVTDMQGRIIGTAVVNDGSATFDFTSHPSGIYFGKLLKNGELVGTIKVMNAH